MEKSPEQCEAEFKEAKEESAWLGMRRVMTKWVTKNERPAYLIAEFNADGTFSRSDNTRVITRPGSIEKLNLTVDEIFKESRESREGTSET